MTGSVPAPTSPPGASPSSWSACSASRRGTSSGDAPAAARTTPVVVGDLVARSVVDAAAQDLTQITSTSYRNYDEQVAEATTVMTPEFAATYRATAASLAPTFQERQREIAAEVVSSAVVRATDRQVQALVYLDSFVSEQGASRCGFPTGRSSP